jgi:hypothetical protein
LPMSASLTSGVFDLEVEHHPRLVLEDVAVEHVELLALEAVGLFSELRLGPVLETSPRGGSEKFKKFGYESPLGEICRWVKTEYPARP